MGILQDIFGIKRAEAPTQATVQSSPVATSQLKEGEIDFETLTSVDLRIATVLAAEPVSGSEKLLKLSVDFGEEQPRQVLSGIAKSFSPEEVIGKQFAFVANLPPRKMMGLESQGMIMAADSDTGLALVSPTTTVKPGSRLH